MKNLIASCFLLSTILLFSSCGSQKKSSEKDTTTSKTSSSNTSKSETPAVTTENKLSNPDTTAARPNQKTVDQTGAEIIDNAVKRLTSRLSLSGEQAFSVKGILTKTFSEMGRSTDTKYTADEAMKINQELMQKSKTQIESILNETQKAELQKKRPH